MKRITLDTNIVSRIADVPGFIEQIREAAARHPFIIIGNPMVRYELEQTADRVRREQILAVWDALPRRDVLTRGGYYGVGLKYGQSRYGDGSGTGLPLSEARTGGRGGARDAIIGTTAAGEADVLVTNDGKLATRVRCSAAPCEVWDFEQFRRFVLSASGDPGTRS